MLRPPRTPARPDSVAAAPRLLLTGFDAFGGATANPSWLLASSLDGERIAGHSVVAACLPTAFGTALQALDAALAHHRPALVLCLGQAGGRSALSLERVAINIDDARIPDNQGAQPVDMPVVDEGPAAYFATLPLKAMLVAVQALDIPAEVSQTAGTFVCNHVFYGLMHRLATVPGLRGTRGGFMHVPFATGQGHPSVALEEMRRGVRAALECALRTQDDLRLAAGTEH